MRLMLLVMSAVVVALMANMGAPHAARAEITVAIVGSELSGDPMNTACTLRAVSPPSNTFSGGCEVLVGSERLTLAGLDVSGQPVVSTVLDRRLTIRGLAATGSGRFLQLATDALAGFPIYLHVDPFARAWVIERDVPGDGREPVAEGVISGGRLELEIP